VEYYRYLVDKSKGQILTLLQCCNLLISVIIFGISLPIYFTWLVPGLFCALTDFFQCTLFSFSFSSSYSFMCCILSPVTIQNFQTVDPCTHLAGFLGWEINLSQDLNLCKTIQHRKRSYIHAPTGIRNHYSKRRGHCDRLPESVIKTAHLKLMQSAVKYG